MYNQQTYAEKLKLRVSDHDQIIPRMLLRAMAALAFVSLALVTFAVLSDRPHEAQTFTAPVEKSLVIQIKEGPGGVVTVFDMNGNVLSDSSRPAAGFISVVQNSLAFQRKRHGITGTPPVTLVRFADGRLGLRDDATGWKIHLTGFGQDNHRAFAAIMAE